MSKRSAGNSGGSVVAGVVLACAIGGGLWYAWQNRAALTTRLPAAPVATPVTRPPATPVVVQVDEVVRGASPLRDEQFGIGVPAGPLALVRTVELLQWQERCSGSTCEYAKAWSPVPIDSTAFRRRKGHENNGQLPFRSRTFAAADLRAGDLRLDPAFAQQLPMRNATVTPLPAQLAQLPPNLAATFREREGALYAGDPAKPAIGDLRVRYSTLTLVARQNLAGVRDGDRLRPAPR